MSAGNLCRFRVLALFVAALSLVASMSGATTVGAATTSSAVSGPPSSLATYPLPNPNSEAWDLAPGPDGNMWAPYSFASTIARITPAGSIHEFPVPPFLIFPVITTGPDGNLWFLPSNGDVDRMTPDAATVTPFHIPSGNGGPNGITAGPDGR
ncbi:MAG: hypothetical protein LC749_08550 [Actinobacteria bacterium]|nr:hypothetical protein [Actinomycetota bacterium]